MKLLYASGFSVAEKKRYRRIIFSNILISLREILDAMVFYGVTFATEENKVLSLPIIPYRLGFRRDEQMLIQSLREVLYKFYLS
jgi:hypothetical protein